MKYELIETAVADIMPGDTILHDGYIRTVTATNIKRGFMGPRFSVTLTGPVGCWSKRL